MHDAHLACALFFLDMLAAYTLLSVTVMVAPCLWYVVRMNLVCPPMSKFPQAPFARAPFGESRDKNPRISYPQEGGAEQHPRFSLFSDSGWRLLWGPTGPSQAETPLRTLFRDPKLNTNFFSQNFRAPPGYPGKNPGISRPKVGFPGFRRTYRTVWPPQLYL